MTKRAYRMSIMGGQVVAQKEMEAEQLIAKGAQEFDEYLDLDGRYVGMFVLLHEDGVDQLLDSGEVYELDGAMFVLEYPEYMESGKMNILWSDTLEDTLASDRVREAAIPVTLL